MMVEVTTVQESLSLSSTTETCVNGVAAAVLRLLYC